MHVTYMENRLIMLLSSLLSCLVVLGSKESSISGSAPALKEGCSNALMYFVGTVKAVVIIQLSTVHLQCGGKQLGILLYAIL